MLELAIASAAAVTQVYAAGLPPWTYGGGLEVQARPLSLRADAGFFSSLGGWSVVLTMPFDVVEGLQVGPVVGVGEIFSSPVCPAMPGIACSGSVPGPGVFPLGLSARWQRGPWWVAVTPTVTLTPQLPLPPRPGSGDPYLAQPPRVDWYLPLFGCPPVLEVGYQYTPSIGVAMRTAVTPLAVSWTF